MARVVHVTEGASWALDDAKAVVQRGLRRQEGVAREALRRLGAATVTAAPVALLALAVCIHVLIIRAVDRAEARLERGAVGAVGRDKRRLRCRVEALAHTRPRALSARGMASLALAVLSIVAGRAPGAA